MVAIGPDAAAAVERSVDRESHANRETSHAFRKMLLVPCFDHQMNVVGLHREMQKAKPSARGSTERFSHFEKNRLSTQAR
jgi:hypothetical protein